MNLRKLIVPILCVLIGFTSCKKDDGDDVVLIPLRDRGEQQIVDNDSIVKYLKSHYYNASAFEGNTNASSADLIITDISDPDNNKRLFGAAALDSIQVVYADTNYNVYYLKLNQGGGSSPKFSDNVRINYEGFTLDNSVFDNSVNPVTTDLMDFISGWRKVVPLFNTASSFVENGDGTVTYTNHGVGVMFLPSGLAYFSSSSTGILAYSPLIFKFDLFEMEENDHDNDGIPSYLEDLPYLMGNGEFFTTAGLADDDTDGDGIPNYLDADDDGDGVPTKREDLNKDGNFENDDSNGNGIPNYRDKEDTEANIV